MKFAIVNPKLRIVDRIEAEEANDAVAAAGLKRLQTDNGVLARLPSRGGLGYIVYEFGLFVPAATQSYCGLFGRLVAGPAVIYEFDEAGYTVSLDDYLTIEPIWFDDADHVMRAIRSCLIARPEMSIGRKIVWQWPEPRLSDSEMDALVAGILKGEK